jgi:Tol biopolymer transport system component
VVRDSAIAYGGSWGSDGRLYFTSNLGRAILRVSADGGEPELVVRADSAEQELGFRWPQVLPGARGLVMTRWRTRGDPEIVHLDLRSGRMRVLTGGLQAWYVESGHLAIARGTGVMSAMRFDAGAGEIEGRAVDLERGFRVEIGGIPAVGVSSKGTLAYRRADGNGRLVRVTRAGRVEVVDSAMRGQFHSVALSPDGTRAAIAVMADGRGEIWVKALDDGPFARTITAGTYAYRPSWSNDARSILFTSDLRGLSGVFSGSADGGAVAALPAVPGPADEVGMTRDGRWLVLRTGSGGRRNIYRTRLDGDATALPLATSDDEEYSPHVSPDGRWLAYGSNGSGQDEIFVTRFDASGGRIQVSVAGGSEPLWSHSGRELFYRDMNENLVSAAVAPGAEFRVVSRRVLFSTARYRTDGRHRAYDVSPDDQSFYFVDRVVTNAAEVVVVRNWMADASARME